MATNLEKIFSGRDRARLFRFFLNNPRDSFLFAEILSKMQINRASARRELKFLESVDFLKKVKVHRTIEVPTRKKDAKPKIKKLRGDGWKLNNGFEFLRPFSQIFVDSNMFDSQNFVSHLRGLGTFKLILLLGFFIHDEESRVDLLIVGNKLKRTQIENVIHRFEAEIGRELRYVILEESEFLYRLQMYDRLVRDIISAPHRAILDKIKTQWSNL